MFRMTGLLGEDDCLRSDLHVGSCRVPRPELTSSLAPDGWVCLLSGVEAITGNRGDQRC